MRRTRFLLCAGLLCTGATLSATLPASAQKPAAKPTAAKPAAAKPAASAAGPALPSKIPLSAPFAIVNGVSIPVSEYLDRMSMAFGGQMREALVEEVLVREEAKRRKISASPAEVDAVVNRVFNDNAGRYGGEAGLADELKKTRGWTLSDYKSVIRVQAGVQVLRTKIAASLVPASAVKDADIEARYEAQRSAFAIPDTVRISHILVRRAAEGEAADAEAKTKAERLLEKASASQGAEFDKIAKESSDDKISGAQGGVIPTDIVRGGNPFGAEFESQVFSAPVGVLKQVIPTPLGYHIIRVDSRKEGRQLPLTEVKTQVRDGLLAEKRQQAFEELFVRLRTAAKVEVGKF
jgi:foldase protein PrsA